MLRRAGVVTLPAFRRQATHSAVPCAADDTVLDTESMDAGCPLQKRATLVDTMSAALARDQAAEKAGIKLAPAA